MSLLIGIAVGLVLGLTGAGGSIFAVPLLMTGLGWPITQAATTALLAVAVAASVGTVTAWRHSYVRYRAATLMALTGACAAPAGILLADRLPVATLTTTFAVVLAAVALRMFGAALRSGGDAAVVRAAVAGEGEASHGDICAVDPGTGRLIWNRTLVVAMSLIGLMTGFLSGLLGVGGGFVIVPALRATTPLSMHSAVATSLMTIALISLGSVVSGLALGRNMPLLAALPFVGGAVIGMMLGRRVAPRIAGAHLQQAFAVMALAVAALLLHRAWSGAG